MEQEQNLIFGVNPVAEKLKASLDDVLEILVSDTSDREVLRSICREAQRLGVRVVSVDRRMLDKLAAGHRHQGVVARVKAYRYLSFGEMADRIKPQSVCERILFLDGVTDPRNFGAILRTADGAGVRYVVIPRDRSVEVTPLVTKASAGATHHVNVVKVTNLRRAISDIKKLGYWVAGLDAQSRDTIYRGDLPARLAVVLGSEGTGVRPINLRECDFTLSIPMLGKVASLNVSVAAAVFLYELLRQSR
jgi:23S rRNA (guanosine2251-2'-O)-methyltransferase